MKSKYNCFICNKALRSSYFPFSLAFWLPRPRIVVIYLTTREEIAYFAVCPDDASWVRANSSAAEATIMAKLELLEKSDEA